MMFFNQTLTHFVIFFFLENALKIPIKFLYILNKK